MKKYIKLFIFCGLFLFALGMVSCEDYLDKDPDSTVSPTEAYKNFYNFQGFTEELYNCIPDFAKGYWNNSFNWGEDEIISSGVDHHFGYKIDNGNFWGWQREHDGWQSGWMDRNGTSTTGDRFAKSLYPLAWIGIRKCNMGLENFDLMEGTQEEKNLIKGQLLFFRGWFHFQLMQYFGGLPYIDRVLPSDEPLKEPRLSYHECADKAAADFAAAAAILPIDWDKISAGNATLGKNQLRINKIMALGYLGKNYLWAASPLMNFQSTGSKSYNTDYAKKAADAFAELLELVESGKTQYALVDFEKYSDLFYTNGQNWRMPGSTEAIFRGPSYGANDSNWGLSKQYTPLVINGGGGLIFSPTANYVSYYGMANGLPINETFDGTKTDSESGYSSQYPWRDRDPRFYHDITFDTKQTVKGIPKVNGKESPENRYANLYTGGSYREAGNGGSRTGYLMYKFIPMTANDTDDGYGWSNSNHIHLSWMRLADIYLMYAEAAAIGYNGPNAKSPKFSKTALDAINTIRDRAGVGHVADKYLTSTDQFMKEVRRERAVELAFEGHRFNDLRRWLLLTEEPYTKKTSHEFDRPAGEINTEDPSQNGVLNLTEKVILIRNFSDKHYWFPLKRNDVNMYPEFYQNPGW